MEQVKKQILLVLLLCLLGGAAAFAQKAEFKKADALYRVKSYAEAIPLYEKGLTETDSKSARSKLAFSYKKLNQVKKAAALYEKLVTEKRVRSDDYFNYGEVLMSQAKYPEAKVWFLKFHELEPDEEKGLQMAESCDQIPFLTPIFPEATVMEFPYNTDFDDSSPIFYNNKLVFSSDRKTGVKLLKQKSGTTGRDFIRLYSSTLDDQQQWSAPKSFSGRLNEHNKNNANASFSSDGNAVYFTRNGNTSNRKNAFTLQIHSARKEKEKWKGIEILSFCRLAYNYMHPAISPDGNTLFFVSDKPGGKGGTDIFYSEKKGDEWGRAINLDSTINTAASEGFPFMNKDGKLYFCSKGHVGYGGFDIFVTEKLEDGTWAEPVNVGQPINSSMDDITIVLNAENTRGAFTSSRRAGNDDIFLFAMDGSISDSDEFVATTEMEATEPIATELSKTEDLTLSEVPMEEESMVIDEVIIETVEEVTSIETLPDNSVSKPEIITNEIPNTSIPEMEITEVTNMSSTEMEPTEPIIEEVTSIETLPENNISKPEIITNEIPVTPVPEPEITVVTNLSNTEMTPAAEVIEEEVEVEMEKSQIPNARALPIMETTDVSINKPAPAMNDVNVAPAEKPQVMTETVSFQPETPENVMAKEAMSVKSFRKAVNKGKYDVGMYYVLENMRYLPGEYLLAPKMTLELEPIANMLLEQPELKLEISVHTQSLGYDNNNMTVSQKRAKAIKNYLLYKGIGADRVVAVGVGETKLVNHCANGVVCEEEEHMANQRVEVRVR